MKSFYKTPLLMILETTTTKRIKKANLINLQTHCGEWPPLCYVMLKGYLERSCLMDLAKVLVWRATQIESHPSALNIRHDVHRFGFWDVVSTSKTSVSVLLLFAKKICQGCDWRFWKLPTSKWRSIKLKIHVEIFEVWWRVIWPLKLKLCGIFKSKKLNNSVNWSSW